MPVAVAAFDNVLVPTVRFDPVDVDVRFTATHPLSIPLLPDWPHCIDPLLH